LNYYAHPTAIIEDNVKIGAGCRIWHFVHIREGAEIGAGCNIGKGVYIDKKVKIGNNIKIQNFANIYKGVILEDDVFIGPGVMFTNDLFPRAFIWSESSIIPTVVKKGASIGANSTIICGVTIGEYALIGAGSVVTRDVPPFTLVYGNPARVRAYVCYCGRKLNNIIDKTNEYTLYKCENCGKSVKISTLEK